MLIIETERLKLRKFVDNDWRDLYEYLSKETVVKYEPYDVFTEETCKIEAIDRSKNDAFWAVCLKRNDKVIGNVVFKQKEPKKDLTWEIGFVFNPEFYGNGYAMESCKAVINFGFDQLKVRKVIAMCDPENVSSWKLLERLKMRRQGYKRNSNFSLNDEDAEPNLKDSYEYVILREEWNEN
jgi:RimJ/RimL family protein N-acetyltransferase